MATTYWTSPSGTGNGLSSGTPMSFTSACSTPGAGDTVNLLTGNYPSFPPITHNGTSSLPLVFQAAAGNTPIIEGGVQLNSASFVSSPINGGNYGTNIYRITGTGLSTLGTSKIWVNDPITNTMGSAGPTGRNCAPQDMGQPAGVFNNSGTINPTRKIHTNASMSSPPTGYWGQLLLQDDFQYKINGVYLSDGTSDTTDGPAGSIDLRLGGGNYNPTAYQIWYALGGIGLNLSGQSYITFKDIAFRHWKNWVWLSGCNGIVFDHCDFRFAGHDGIVCVNTTTNCTIKNSQLIMTGSPLTADQNTFALGSATSRLTVDNNTIKYWGHDAFYVYPPNGCDNIAITNNEIAFGGGGINFTNTNPPSPEAQNLNCAGNFIHHCGTPDIEGWDGEILHPGIEANSIQNGIIRDNVFWHCAQGFNWSGSKRSAALSGNKVFHNTFADCRDNDILLGDNQLTWQGISSNTFSNNLYYWSSSPGSSDSLNNHPSAVALNLVKTGSLGTWAGNTFSHELFYSPGGGVLVWDFELPSGGGSYTTVSAIQSAINVITGSVGGTSDNIFNNYTTNKSTAVKGDFTLKAGSPALGAGIAISSSIDPIAASRANPPDIGAFFTSATHSAPTCTITVSPGDTGLVSFAPSFAGGVSLGDGTSIITYAWNFNSTNQPNGPNPSTANVQNPGTVTYGSAGTFTVTFSATDNNNQTGNANHTITVTAPSNNTVLQNGSVLAAFATIAIPPSSTDTTSVQAASVGPPYSGSYAFDNQYGTADIDSTEWIKDPTTNLPATLTCDLTGQVGVNMDVDRVRIMFRKYTSRTHGYNLKHSQDAVTWTTLIAATNSTLNNQWGDHPFALTRTRFLQLQIVSTSDGTQNAGVAEMQIYAKAVAAGGGGGGGGGGQGAGYTWVSFTDPLGSSRIPFGPQQLLLGRDPTKLDAMARWLWDLTLPCDLICDMGASANNIVGRVRLFPFKAAQQISYVVNISVQANGSSSWVPVASNITTSTTALYTDISFTPTAATTRKIRITFSSANRGTQCGLWKVDAFAS